MAWIKLDHVTPDKPEVHRMAEVLKLDADAVLGKLLRLWIWADQQTITGNAPSVNTALIDRIASHEGFALAMVKVEWLAVDLDGAIFPKFDRHNGKSAKNRALTAKRVEKYRNDSVTQPALVEKRRKEKRSNPPIPPPKVDDATALEIYQRYPRKVGRTAALRAIKRALARIAESGEASDPAAYLRQQVEAFAESAAGKAGKYTPHPATWMNAGRYDDAAEEWQDQEPERKPVAGHDPDWARKLLEKNQ